MCRHVLLVHLLSINLCFKCGDEIDNNFLESSIAFLAELTLSANLGQEVLLRSSQVLQELSLELGDLVRLELIQVTTHTSVDDADLLLNRQWNLKQHRDNIRETIGRKYHIKNIRKVFIMCILI